MNLPDSQESILEWELQKKLGENVNNSAQLIIYKDWFETFDTRHGVASKPQAKNELITVLKEKGRESISTRELFNQRCKIFL